MSKHYFISELFPHAYYTAGILRNDIETVLRHENYEAVELPDAAGNLVQKFTGYQKAWQLANEIESGSIVFFHFPVRARISRFFFNRIKRSGSKTVAYIHDLEGLRDQNEKVLSEELRLLSTFDLVIAQNKAMKNFLLQQPGMQKIIVLEMYDYLDAACPSSPQRAKSNHISFAGNPAKAGFIHQLDQLPGLQFTIYGITGEEINTGQVRIKNKVDPRLLPGMLEGSFGLVWDGDRIDRCSGYGDYLRYNIPHKLALYIMAGLPVIVWDQSAMAEWVTKQQIGFAVPSLDKINNQIASLSTDAYHAMQENMLPLSHHMKQGGYMKKIISDINKEFNHKKRHP